MEILIIAIFLGGCFSCYLWGKYTQLEKVGFQIRKSDEHEVILKCRNCSHLRIYSRVSELVEPNEKGVD